MAMKRNVRIAGNLFKVTRYKAGTWKVEGPHRTVEVTDFNGARDEVAWQVVGGDTTLPDRDDLIIARNALLNAGY